MDRQEIVSIGFVFEDDLEDIPAVFLRYRKAVHGVFRTHFRNPEIIWHQELEFKNTGILHGEVHPRIIIDHRLGKRDENILVCGYPRLYLRHDEPHEVGAT